MDIETHRRIARALKVSGALKRGGAPSAYALSFEFSMLLLVGLAYWTATPQSAWAVLVAPIGGVVLFRWFLILHEAGHSSLFKSVALNRLVGIFAGGVCLIPYGAWVELHRAHHQWVGVVDHDPTQRHLVEVHREGKFDAYFFKLGSRAIVPIVFFAFVAAIIWGNFLHHASHRRWQLAAIGAADLVVAITIHIIVLQALGISTALFVALLQFTIFLLLLDVVNTPQHSELAIFNSDDKSEPIPLYEQDTVTRSTPLSDRASLFLFYNFNRHIEHHLFPSAPCFALNTIHAMRVHSPPRRFEWVT